MAFCIDSNSHVLDEFTITGKKCWLSTDFKQVLNLNIILISVTNHRFIDNPAPL